MYQRLVRGLIRKENRVSSADKMPAAPPGSSGVGRLAITYWLMFTLRPGYGWSGELTAGYCFRPT
jgi:hypothetical protein